MTSYRLSKFMKCVSAYLALLCLLLPLGGMNGKEWNV